MMFIWNDKELPTYGDVMRAMRDIHARNDSEEAQQFMAAYRESNEHADPNVGYMTGYFGRQTAAEMRELFDVSHPIFGRESPTPEQALEAGKRAALGEFPSATGDTE